MKQLPVSFCFKSSGFTLVELITVMIIIGIMAVAVLPRFTNRQNFDTRGFFDQVKAAVQYARKAAIAERRNVCVVIAGNTFTITQGLTFNAACSVPLKNPATGADFTNMSATSTNTSSAGITLTATSSPINFDAQGSTTTASTVTVGGTLSFVVEANTGYVH